MAFSDDLITRTQAIFSDATNQNLTQEQARECAANVAGFFDVLSQWQRNATTSPSNTPEKSPPSPTAKAQVPFPHRMHTSSDLQSGEDEIL